MINKILLVKYAEVHLKGQNRPYFQRLLLNHVREAVKPFGAVARLHDSRIMVTGYHDEEACAERVCRVFGVHAVCPTVEMPKDDFEAICAQAAAMMQGLAGTFKVTARRADKRFFLDSPQINAKIGGRILEECPGLSVDVHHPQHVLQVEIRDHALLYASDIPAVGGLPIGSNGKAMLLLSGGIDSPVAGFRVAKRGVQLSAVYFHSFPFTGEQTKDKVRTLAEILASYCGPIRLHVVPFTELQTTIHERCPDDFTTLIMRRFMMRIAEIIARKEGAQALVTGESIGQVASQTMESIVCTDVVVQCPVFRPLIGTDKLEIIRESEKIGTYMTSCLPYEDCCTVFTPRHPVTHPKKHKAEAAEKALTENDQLGQMIARAVEGTELLTVAPIESI